MKTLRFLGLVACLFVSLASCSGGDVIYKKANETFADVDSNFSKREMVQEESHYAKPSEVQGNPLAAGLASADAMESIKINLAGRILVDAGVFDSKSKDFANGMAMPDQRIGAKAYYGDYYGKIDIGFAGSSVKLKDIYIERKISPSSTFKVGYYIPTFGLQSITSSSQKVAFEELVSNGIFSTDRSVGVSYGYNKGVLFGATTAFVENRAMYESSDKTGRQAYGFAGRFVYRSVDKSGVTFHIGISGAYEKPRWNNDTLIRHKSFNSNINFPTRIAHISAAEATVKDAKNMIKFAPEILFASGPIGVEAQYTQANIARERGFANYMAHGAQATLRGLILGGNYEYSKSSSGLSIPKPGSLEYVLSYSYADMSHNKTNVLGGEVNDIALSLSYYINKYIMWRFRYSYTEAKNREKLNNEKLNAFQTRLQIIF